MATTRLHHFSLPLETNALNIELVSDSRPLGHQDSITHFVSTLQPWISHDLFSDLNKNVFSELQTQADSLIEATTLPDTDPVINLSSRQLTTVEWTTLQRGLKSCPTPGEPTMADLVRDMDHFQDNLWWDYHFHDNPVGTTPFEKCIMLNKTLKKKSRHPHPRDIRI